MTNCMLMTSKSPSDLNTYIQQNVNGNNASRKLINGQSQMTSRSPKLKLDCVFFLSIKAPLRNSPHRMGSRPGSLSKTT